MSKATLTITNTSGSELELGSVFGGDLEDGETRSVTVSSSRITRNDINTLEQLKLEGKVTVSISIPAGVDNSLLAKLMDAFVAKSFGQRAEIWVSVDDGDDSNPGTKRAPYKTIEQAMDDLWDEYGHGTKKTVKIINKGNDYPESIKLFGRSNWLFMGVDENGEPSTVDIDGDGDLPALTATNMPKDDFDQYVADGGPNFTWDGSTYTYTGAQLADRPVESEINDFGQAYVLDVEFKNISFQADFGATHSLPISTLSMLIVGAGDENDSDDDVQLRGITFTDSKYDPSDFDEQTVAFFKNCFIEVQNPTVNFSGNFSGEPLTEFRHVLDNALINGWSPVPVGGAEQSQPYHFIIRHDNSVVDTEGTYNDFAPSSQQFSGINTLGKLDFLGAWGTPSDPFGPGLLEGINVLGDLRVDATGQFVYSFMKFEQNVSLLGGGNHYADQTVIFGNLTVDATTNIDFKQVTVVGDVTLNSGAGTVSWKGGSIHGTITDPDSKLGGAAAGSYLNV